MAEEASEPYFTPIKDISEMVSHVTGGHGDHGHSGGHLGYLEEFSDIVGEFGISRALVWWCFFIIVAGGASYLMPEFLRLAFGWVVLFGPLWMVIGLGIAVVKTWVWYVRAEFLHTRKPVLLEMKFPTDLVKSPRAMEAAITGFWDVNGETTFIDRNWDGGCRTWYSFELVSFGGEVHFYIWCWSNFRSRTEAFMYAQYPEIELIEVEDYASKFDFDPVTTDLFANQMLLEKDPNPWGTHNDIPGRCPPIMGIYPIRSYIDYEMDKDPKEEYKVDPMAQIVERLSNLKGSEQAWTQIVFRANTNGNFQTAVQAEIEMLRRQSASFEGPLTDQEARTMRARGTWRQQEQIMAIERHAGKRQFDVGIRICYIARYEDYNGANRNSMRWLYLPYNSSYLNRLRPKRWHGDFDYPWQDFRGIRWIMTIRRFLDAYRRRSYFHAPWVSPAMTMSAESLASLFHPPSSGIKSPNLRRIPAKKASPPANLPR